MIANFQLYDAVKNVSPWFNKGGIYCAVKENIGYSTNHVDLA